MEIGSGILLLVVLFVVAAALYLLPTLIAFSRNHHQFGAIVVVNVFLGWTFLGWVIALAWSCSAIRHNL